MGFQNQNRSRSFRETRKSINIFCAIVSWFASHSYWRIVFLFLHSLFLSMIFSFYFSLYRIAVLRFSLKYHSASVLSRHREALQVRRGRSFHRNSSLIPNVSSLNTRKKRGIFLKSTKDFWRLSILALWHFHFCPPSFFSFLAFFAHPTSVQLSSGMSRKGRRLGGFGALAKTHKTLKLSIKGTVVWIMPNRMGGNNKKLASKKEK